MRYSVIAKSLKPDQFESEIKKAGGSDIVKTKLLGHVFCEMDETQAEGFVTGLRSPGEAYQRI